MAVGVAIVVIAGVFVAFSSVVSVVGACTGLDVVSVIIVGAANVGVAVVGCLYAGVAVFVVIASFAAIVGLMIVAGSFAGVFVVSVVIGVAAIVGVSSVNGFCAVVVVVPVIIVVAAVVGVVVIVHACSVVVAFGIVGAAIIGIKIVDGSFAVRLYAKRSIDNAICVVSSVSFDIGENNIKNLSSLGRLKRDFYDRNRHRKLCIRRAVPTRY